MKNVKVMVIEDNQADIDLIKYAFKKNHYTNELIVVKDGEEALDYLLTRCKIDEEKKPELIILDINIPKVNGLEVLRQVKEDEEMSVIPVTILSTSCSDADVIKAYKDHVNAYLVKPTDVDEFIEVIDQLLKFMTRIIKRTPNGCKIG